VAERDPAAGEIVWGDFHRDAVPLEHANPEAAHVTAQRGKHGMTIGERHAKSRVGQHLGHGAFELYRFFLCHLMGSGGAGEASPDLS
jgi:hypothetical protein